MADREKIIKNVKRCGSVMTYVGAANIVRPFVAKARENTNGPMQMSTIFCGTVLSLGLGKLGCKWMNTAIDKVVDFYDDVKPKKKAKPAEKEEEKEDNG